MKLSKTVALEQYSKKQLSKSIQEWLEAAKIAANTAYAPYSNFKVGCSVISENRVVETGSNQENSSFPSGLCAERVALFKCGTLLNHQKIDAIIVYATSEAYQVPSPLVPCAGCLQVIIDIEQRQEKPIDIWMWNEEKDEIFKAVGCNQFLPFHFELHKK